MRHKNAILTLHSTIHNVIYNPESDTYKERDYNNYNIKVLWFCRIVEKGGFIERIGLLEVIETIIYSLTRVQLSLI